jgi:hypothetical protein
MIPMLRYWARGYLREVSAASSAATHTKELREAEVRVIALLTE